MICSSMNLLFRMTPPFEESHNYWIRFRGSAHAGYHERPVFGFSKLQPLVHLRKNPPKTLVHVGYLVQFEWIYPCLRAINAEIGKPLDIDSIFVVAPEAPAIVAFTDHIPKDQPKEQSCCVRIGVTRVLVNRLEYGPAPVGTRNPTRCVDFSRSNPAIQLISDRTVLVVRDSLTPDKEIGQVGHPRYWLSSVD